MLECVRTDYIYLPVLVKNGIALLPCIYELSVSPLKIDSSILTSGASKVRRIQHDTGHSLVLHTQSMF